MAQTKVTSLLPTSAQVQTSARIFGRPRRRARRWSRCGRPSVNESVGLVHGAAVEFAAVPTEACSWMLIIVFSLSRDLPRKVELRCVVVPVHSDLNEFVIACSGYAASTGGKAPAQVRLIRFSTQSALCRTQSQRSPRGVGVVPGADADGGDDVWVGEQFVRKRPRRAIRKPGLNPRRFISANANSSTSGLSVGDAKVWLGDTTDADHACLEQHRV